ncbi:hypothetical protein AWB71_01037 [Caballeronia peredens]|nr:hypothetical protein AWB71_01037 [Caballeronia peredens]
MNKTYKVVWNAASESWIAVPEFAKAKGKGRGRAVAVASVSSVLSLLTGSAHALGPANSYSVGLLGPGGLCLNTQTLTGLSTGSSCDGGGSFAAGTVAYTATGAMDSWMIIDANKTISMGVNKNKMFTISASAGINAYADLSMNTSNKIKDLKAGDVYFGSQDAINGSQLYDLASSTAASLGGRADVEDGTVTPPTYSVYGTAYHNVGDALDALQIGFADKKYFHANSTLADSSASGVESVAIGGNAQATADNSVALGSNSVADRANSVSVGAAGAERQIINVADGANGTDAVNVSQLKNEIGTNLANVVKYDADDHKSVTLGGSKTAPAVTLDNVAAGEVSGNSLQAVNGSQLFDVAQSTADALGGGASVSPDGKVTAPTYTFADNSSFNNVGNALSNLDGRVASNTSFINNINNGGGIKYFHANSTLADSSASGVESVAIGGNAQATADNSVALGSNSVADRANSVSVGAKGAERQIINVAEGANGTDAVNVSQLKNEIGTNLANVVKYDDDTHTSVTLGGKGAPAVTLDNVAAGEVSGNSLQAVNGSQLFNVAQSTADALGGGASVDSDGKVTAPTYTFADNSTFNNVGNALSDLDGRVAANTSDIGNMVNGGGIKYFHANSTLADSLATGEESVAIGGNAQATANNSVALGSNSVADRANTVSVGAKGAERQITNVAAGKEDTDAVNVAQLKAAGLINGDGTAKTAVTYDTTASGETDYSSITLGDGNSGGTVIHNVANGMDGTDAVNLNQMNAALDSVKNIAESGGNPMFAAQGNRDTEAAIATGAHATAMGANANASADNSVALGANSVADRVNTVSVGSAGNERQITNVAAGTQATDAVNVQQLNLAAAQAQSYTDSRISGVQQQISDVASKAYGGIASAMAVAGLPQPTAPGKTMVAMAGSRYAGATGAALGVSYVTQDERWVVKLSGNTSSYGNVGFVFGSGYQW